MSDGRRLMGGDGDDPFPWLLLIGWTLTIAAPLLVLVWILIVRH